MEKFFFHFINDPLLKIENFLNLKLRKTYEKPEIKYYKNLLEGKLKAGNGGQACYLSSSLNTLRAWFVLHQRPIPSELNSYEGALKFAVKYLKNDSKYGHYFRHLEDGPELLLDYDFNNLTIVNIVPSLIFKKYFGEKYAESLVTMKTDKGALFNASSLLNFIYDLRAGNPSNMSYLVKGNKVGYQVTVLGFIPGKDWSLFEQILKSANGWIIASECQKKMATLKQNWDLGGLIVFDQASMAYKEYSLNWACFECDQLSAITPNSIFSDQAKARSLEKLYSQVNFVPGRLATLPD